MELSTPKKWKKPVVRDGPPPALPPVATPLDEANEGKMLS